MRSARRRKREDLSGPSETEPNEVLKPAEERAHDCAMRGEIDESQEEGSVNDEESSFIDNSDEAAWPVRSNLSFAKLQFHPFLDLKQIGHF